jgi:pyridoxine 5-phosphate synthase
MSATILSVNLNKVALLRNARPLAYPDPVRFALIALAAGAGGITVHPRPDARHIRPADVDALAEALREWPGCEFNLEGNPEHGLLELVERVRPAQATFVPDTPEASTSDHGYDLAGAGDRLRAQIARARAAGARVSLFVNAEPDAMAHAAALGAQRVELYTEPFAQAWGTAQQASVTARYRTTAEAAIAAGLEVNAGHDLSLANLGDFIAGVPGVVEVSIGHALVAEALEFGMADTVRRYVATLRRAGASGGAA